MKELLEMLENLEADLKAFWNWLWHKK